MSEQPLKPRSQVSRAELSAEFGELLRRARAAGDMRNGAEIIMEYVSLRDEMVGGLDDES